MAADDKATLAGLSDAALAARALLMAGRMIEGLNQRHPLTPERVDVLSGPIIEVCTRLLKASAKTAYSPWAVTLKWPAPECGPAEREAWARFLDERERARPVDAGPDDADVGNVGRLMRHMGGAPGDASGRLLYLRNRGWLRWDARRNALRPAGRLRMLWLGWRLAASLTGWRGVARAVATRLGLAARRALSPGTWLREGGTR